jgi:cytochrome P450
MLRSMGEQEDPLKRVPSDHLPAYIVEMLAAGSSTTSHTVAFACYLLARHPESQRRLREELFGVFPNVNLVEPKKMTDLPLLDGVLKETMRMYPMIPGPLERYLGKEIELDGQKIPPGVIASTSAYTQGRLQDVFPEPESWKPERWLNASKKMESNWIPFRTGCRACPGANMAVTELKYMIGTIFRSFRSVIPPGHDQDVLELADIFAAGSRTGHCWLKCDLAEKEI